MKLDVKIDTSRLQARTFKEQKRLVYNTVEAINKTALAAQAEVRSDLTKAMRLRKGSAQNRKFLQQQIKLQFASVKKGMIYAELFVDKKPRLLLAIFEKGGKREPFVGKTVARPVSGQARVGGTEAGAVKKQLTFKALNLKPFRLFRTVRSRRRAMRSSLNDIVQNTTRTSVDLVQYKGKHRTFLLKSTAKHPLGGVFQRIGPGPDDIRMVYSFAKAYDLKALLNMVQTAKEKMADKFRVELAIAYAKAPPS